MRQYECILHRGCEYTPVSWVCIALHCSGVVSSMTVLVELLFGRPEVHDSLAPSGSGAGGDIASSSGVTAGSVLSISGVPKEEDPFGCGVTTSSSGCGDDNGGFMKDISLVNFVSSSPSVSTCDLTESLVIESLDAAGVDGMSSLFSSLICSVSSVKSPLYSCENSSSEPGWIGAMT